MLKNAFNMLDGFKERRAWAAGIMALVFGSYVGMFYLGKGRIGIFYILFIALVIMVSFVLVHYNRLDFSPIELIDIILLIVYLMGFVHCVVIARKYNYPQDIRWYSKWYNILGLFAFSPIFFALMFRVFVFTPFHMPSLSMSPNINIGDYLFAKKYAYGYSKYSLPFNIHIINGKIFGHSPKRGDVVVYKNPNNPQVDYISRVVGMPGKIIQVKQSRLYIDGIMVDRKPNGVYNITKDGAKDVLSQFIETLPNGVSYNILDEYENGELDNTKKYVIPSSHYFVVGDNRDRSIDSRVMDLVGFIPEQNIVAKATIVLWNKNTNKIQSKLLH